MSATLPIVVFTHESVLFGLEAHRVAARGLVDKSTASILPFSALYARHGEHKTAVDERITQWLRLRGQATDWLLGITNSADLIELQTSQIYPLPELLAQRSTFEPLKALGFYQQRLVALLDVERLEQLAKR